MSCCLQVLQADLHRNTPRAILISTCVYKIFGGIRTYFQVAQSALHCYEQTESCLSVTIFALKCKSHPETHCFAIARGVIDLLQIISLLAFS